MPRPSGGWCSSIRHGNLGYRWTHNFQSWLTVVDSTHVIVHTVEGRDVYFSYASTAGGYDYYTPQKGYFAVHLRVESPTKTTWELRRADGTRYLYPEATKLLTNIKDGVGNQITLTYTSGKITKIEDATGYRYLQLE